MNIQHRFIFFIAILGILACRPVFAIGWEEILVLAGIFLLFFGLPIWRFLHTYQKVRKKDEKKK